MSAAGAARRGALVLLPLVFLVVQAQQSGWGEVEHLLFRHTVAVLLWNTVRLAVACTVLCAVLGVGAAWCVRAHHDPRRDACGRSLLVLPLGIPDFVVGFGWVSLEPALHGYLAAVLVMTLSLYPLVYLPVSRALANLDGSQEEASRSLGLRAVAHLPARDTLRQVRPAVLGGCLLVTLGLLAEYGAFEITRYQTFTVAIFTQFKLGFDTVGACVLALVLVALSVAALAGEFALGGIARAARSGPGARRPRRAVALGRLDRPGARRARTAVRAGARGASRRARLLDDPRRLDDAALRLDPRRARPHRRVQRGRRRARDGARGAGDLARRPPSQPSHAGTSSVWPTCRWRCPGSSWRSASSRSPCATPSPSTRARWS